MQTNELYHFGIKGMKWGVRRFQNKDGTRTSAGKSRRKEYSSDYTESRTKKNIRSMSNEELKKRINRYQLENQYRSLEPSVYNKGMTMAKKIIATVGVVGGLYAIKSNAALKAALDSGKSFVKSGGQTVNRIRSEKWDKLW